LMAVMVAMMFLAACSSGGLGDILGGSNDTNTNSNQSYSIQGTVDSIDTANRSIWLTNVTGYNGSMLSSSGSGSGGNSMRVYYDDDTTVDWNGRAYRPQDLERGDQVNVRVDQSGNTMVAQQMSVTYNSSGGMTSGSTVPSNSNYATIRGTVRSVDTYNRTITLEQTSWRSGFNGSSSAPSTITVRYDTGMGINVNGQTQNLSGLERGDVVDVQVQNSSNASSYWAQNITLVRDARY
jgi:hypothetical protein